jgi:superfamily I DNA/RNA helicase
MKVFSPTDQQKDVIEVVLDSGQSALIVAGPGTGKTRTAIELVRRKLSQLSETNHRHILFLSFSNAAIERLASAAGVCFTSLEKKLLRFMTYHSCAAEILRHYGRFVGLPPKISIADKLEERLICIESGWTSDEKVISDSLRTIARTKGLITFDVLVPLAESLLSKSTVLKSVISRQYPLIVVDEFQDTSEAQWKFLKELGEKTQVIAFGDPNQIIYGSMHAATERRMHEFEQWKSVTIKPFSSANFRFSDNSVLDFANCLLNATQFQQVKSENVSLINAQYRSRLRSVVALLWKAIQDKVGKTETIGILAPSNALVEKIAVDLRMPPEDSPIRFPVFVQMARDEAAYDAVFLAVASLHDLARSPSESESKKAAVALLALNSHWNTRTKIKVGQVETLAVELLKDLRDNSTPLANFILRLRSKYDLEVVALEFVECLSKIKFFSTTADRILAHGKIRSECRVTDDSQLSLFESFRSSRTPKGLFGYDAWQGKTHALTYHKAKGREFDFVIMVVDPRHESTKAALDEKRRLYYVSATRAKKWLGVIYFGNEYGAVLGPVIKTK